MAAGDLVSLSKALAWISMSADDANNTVANLISSVSTAIQQFVSYQFASQSYTRNFNGIGSQRLMVPDYPLTAVSSVSVDGTAIPLASSATADGYTFDDRSIFLRGCYRFNRGVQNVTITYTSGYSAVPADVQQACLDWLKVSYDRMNRPADASMIAAGDTKIEYRADMTLSGGRMVAPMPPSVYAMLQPYARVFPA